MPARRPRAALLDTSVLFPAPLRDTLLRAAEAPALFRPGWTQAILDELARNLVEQRRVTPDGVRRLIGALRSAFPEAEITGYDPLVGQMPNHPKDRHVLAAAVHSRTKVIVTENVRHFLRASLEPYGIVARSADSFLQTLFTAYPERMAELIRQQAADLRQPTTTGHVLDRLAIQAPTFARLCRARMAPEP